MLKKLWEVCRRVLSIVLNLAVVLMEPVAIRMSWEAVGNQTFTFYTENSNVFSAVICLLVVLAQLRGLVTGRPLPQLPQKAVGMPHRFSVTVKPSFRSSAQKRWVALNSCKESSGFCQM